MRIILWIATEILSLNSTVAGMRVLESNVREKVMIMI